MESQTEVAEIAHELRELIDDATYVRDLFQEEEYWGEIASLPGVVERLVPRAQLVTSLVNSLVPRLAAIAEYERREAEEDRARQNSRPTRDA